MELDLVGCELRLWVPKLKAAVFWSAASERLLRVESCEKVIDGCDQTPVAEPPPMVKEFDDEEEGEESGSFSADRFSSDGGD